MREHTLKGHVGERLWDDLLNIPQHVYVLRGHTAREIANYCLKEVERAPNLALVVHERMEKHFVFTQRLRNRVYVVTEDEWQQKFPPSKFSPPDNMVFVCALPDIPGNHTVMAFYVCGNWDDAREFSVLPDLPTA